MAVYKDPEELDPTQPLTKINPANAEEKVFWDRVFVALLAVGSTINAYEVAAFADVALQARRKRLEHP